MLDFVYKWVIDWIVYLVDPDRLYQLAISVLRYLTAELQDMLPGDWSVLSYVEAFFASNIIGDLFGAGRWLLGFIIPVQIQSFMLLTIPAIWLLTSIIRLIIAIKNHFWSGGGA
mgnify:CR=1 FL=1